jgi:hypothetical protein
MMKILPSRTYRSIFSSFWCVFSIPCVIRRVDAPKITLFPLGGILLISKDFEDPEVDSEELRERMPLRRRRLAAKASRLSRLFRHYDRACDTEAGNDVEEKDTVSHNGSMGTNSIIIQKTLTFTLPLPSTTSDENIESHEHAAADHRRPSFLVPRADSALACGTF